MIAATQDLDPRLALCSEIQGYLLSPSDRLGWLDYPSCVPVLDKAIAARDGRLAAFGACNPFRSVDGARQMDAGRLGTSHAFRRRGLTRTLVQAARQALQNPGCPQILLNGVTANASAAKLYQALGSKTIYRNKYFLQS